VARIYPEKLARATKSAAEQRLYGLLRDGLDDRFVVFHSAPWLDKAKDREPHDGEADFVIGHPDLGVLVVEVKGGGVRRDGRTGLWESTDRDGAWHEIRDPFDQARRAAYDLREVATSLGDWPSERVRFGRAVAFPDCTYEQRVVPDGPQEIVIDERHLTSIGDRVREIFDWWSFSGDADADGGGLGVRGINALELLLARTFTIPSPLRLEIDADEASIIELTEHQFELLDFLRHQRHALITGVAGAGKTLLAAEHARRLASHMDVLLLCVDRPLARHLARTIGSNDRIEVKTFHELTGEILTEAGVDLTRSDEHRDWWRLEAPALLRSAIRTLARRYDAIIVDEAQDIDSAWWPPILDLLSDANRGIVYVFGDDNQDLYHAGVDGERGIVMPLQLPKFELIQNRRTTQTIHSFAQRFFDPLPDSALPISIGPAGRPVVVDTYPTVGRRPDTASEEAAARALRDCLRRALVQVSHKGKVSNDDVLILTPRWHRSWLVGPGAKEWAGPFRLVKGLTLQGDVIPRPERQSEIRVIRLNDYKGLEAKVVILAEIDGRIDPDELDPLLYIGSTRARAHLIVLADEERATQINDAARAHG
jgi:hypothetical protein